MHRTFCRLRQTDAGVASQRPGGMDGASWAEAFVLRFLWAYSDDRLL